MSGYISQTLSLSIYRNRGGDDTFLLFQLLIDPLPHNQPPSFFPLSRLPLGPITLLRQWHMGRCLCEGAGSASLQRPIRHDLFCPALFPCILVRMPKLKLNQGVVWSRAETISGCTVI